MPAFSGIAPAVGAPPLHPMRAAPRGPFTDLDIGGRGVHRQVGAKIREPHLVAINKLLQRECQRHLPETMMMTIRLALGRDPADAPPAVPDRAGELRRERAPRVQQSFEF